MARRVQGTFTVPCYMTAPDGPGGEPPCSPGSRLNLDADGVPEQNGTWTANFNCMIPYAALDDSGAADDLRPRSARQRERGHFDPAEDARQHPRIMDCATDEIGMSNGDIGNTIGILQNMSDFPELADRLQQGMLDGLFLGRLLIHPQGFISDPAFRVDDTQPSSGANPPVIDTSNLYYNGNSQGAIFGGALTAVAARLHPRVARRRRHELLGAAQPLGRLRHLRGVPRSGLPGRALPAAAALDGPDALGPRRVQRLRATSSPTTRCRTRRRTSC